MSRRNGFEVLCGVSEVECFEEEVDVDPVMGLLVERAARERVADVEDVAVDCFGGIGGCEVLG